MTGFIVAAVLLVAAILAILLPSLLFKADPKCGIERREANLGIFRDQLAELERDRSDGSLSDQDFEQAKRELQRRLLDEVHTETPLPVKAGGRKTALALLFAIPLAAATGYAVLGTPDALDPARTHSNIGTQQIDEMLDKLVARLKENPGDSKGWVMLARSYKALGRFKAAAEAYSHGGELVDQDPALLADYAEVLAQINGGNFEGQPLKLIARALRIDPEEPQALFLAGAAAIEVKDFSSAVDYWSRLLAQLQPGSEEARSLGEAVDKARRILEKSGGQPGRKMQEAIQGISPERIRGKVSISPRIASQARPDDLIFIFARPSEGSRMPLAVVRTRVASLPFEFSLEDSMGLPGGQSLSGMKSVTIEARVSKAGKAQTATGDLFGVVKGVKPGSKDIKLLIDTVQP